jgi:hypothetical protein
MMSKDLKLTLKNFVNCKKEKSIDKKYAKIEL